MPQGENRRPASHGLDHHQAERLRPEYIGELGEQKKGNFLRKAGAIARSGEKYACAVIMHHQSLVHCVAGDEQVLR
jgi:hypothetical protein